MGLSLVLSDMNCYLCEESAPLTFSRALPYLLFCSLFHFCITYFPLCTGPLSSAYKQVLEFTILKKYISWPHLPFQWPTHFSNPFHSMMSPGCLLLAVTASFLPLLLSSHSNKASVTFSSLPSMTSMKPNPLLMSWSYSYQNPEYFQHCWTLSLSWSSLYQKFPWQDTHLLFFLLLGQCKVLLTGFPASKHPIRM